MWRCHRKMLLHALSQMYVDYLGFSSIETLLELQTCVRSDASTRYLFCGSLHHLQSRTRVVPAWLIVDLSFHLFNKQYLILHFLIPNFTNMPASGLQR